MITVNNQMLNISTTNRAKDNQFKRILSKHFSKIGQYLKWVFLEIVIADEVIDEFTVQ